MATGTSVGSFLGVSMKWRFEYSFMSAASIDRGRSPRKAVSPPALLADATYFWCGKSRQNRWCREGARQTAPGALRFSHRTAGSELAPFGRSDMRNRTSPFAAAILGAIEADGWPPNAGCMSEKRPPSVRCPQPAVAAAEHCRAGRKKGRRMSERREQSERSEFGGPRPDRNAQGTGPEAAPAAVGPAASPGSVSWLLLGAPRSNSHQLAKRAAKRPLILNESRRCYRHQQPHPAAKPL